MNNKEFIAALSQQTGYSQAETQKMVNAVVDAMSGAFNEGDSVQIANFGSFEVKKKLERIMVNPATQQRMLVPPKLVLNFKPHLSWKEKLNGGQKN